MEECVISRQLFCSYSIQEMGGGGRRRPAAEASRYTYTLTCCFSLAPGDNLRILLRHYYYRSQQQQQQQTSSYLADVVVCPNLLNIETLFFTIIRFLRFKKEKINK